MRRQPRAPVVTAVGDERPAVVPAGVEDVELVTAARPLLTFPDVAGFWIHRQTMTISVTDGENRRLESGTIHKRIVIGHAAIVAQTHDLSRVVTRILRSLD